MGECTVVDALHAVFPRMLEEEYYTIFFLSFNYLMYLTGELLP